MTTVENCQNIPSNNKTRKENAENNVYVKMKFQSFFKAWKAYELSRLV